MDRFSEMVSGNSDISGNTVGREYGSEYGLSFSKGQGAMSKESLKESFMGDVVICHDGWG